MNAELLVLRLLHVVGGIAWVGFAAFNTWFLGPALGMAGPAGGAVMVGLQKRKLFMLLPIIALVTILSGVRLLMITSTGFSASYFATRSGLTYAAGGAAAIVGFLIALLLTRPKMARVAELMAGRAAADADRQRAIDAEAGTLRAGAASSGLLSTVILLLSAAAMAVARYL
jgi:uncharacterized membrane protein